MFLQPLQGYLASDGGVDQDILCVFVFIRKYKIVHHRKRSHLPFPGAQSLTGSDFGLSYLSSHALQVILLSFFFCNHLRCFYSFHDLYHQENDNYLNYKKDSDLRQPRYDQRPVRRTVKN